MSTLKSLEEIRYWHNQIAGSVALIPTMGGLHQGHLSLVKHAQTLADNAVVSIFVNPTQFDNKDDFAHYPRDLQYDISLLPEDVVVFAPSVEELYGNNQQLLPHLTADTHLNSILCGKHRLGHFDGIVSVIDLLLKASMPDVLLLGEKDYQQTCILKEAATRYEWSTDIITSPTLRMDSGLAFSSRNQHLDCAQQQQAASIYKTLKTIEKYLLNNCRDFATIQMQAEALLMKAGLVTEYVEIMDTHLRPPTNATQQYVALIACYLNKIRLIDNMGINIDA